MRNLSLSLCLVCHFAFGQLTQTEILTKISTLQIEEDSFYDTGLFPSERAWSFSSDPVQDNTIFFSASIASTLYMLRPDLNFDTRQIADSIINRVRSVYSKYQSRNGKPTYNFWQTVPPDLPFPNGNKLISNERLRLPDDFDTSSLIALSLPEEDSLHVRLREEMLSYSARENREKVKLYTAKNYENANAYEFWFGKDMPQAFDLNVISNVLLFVMKNDFRWTEYDSVSSALIKQMIRNEDHLLNVEEISFHTNSPAQILYHVARLLEMDSKGIFTEIKQLVIDDLLALESEVKNEVERVMIHSSLYRLGHSPNSEIDLSAWTEDVRTYSFFSVNPFNISRGESAFLPTVTWTCEAYNWTLLLEMKVLKSNFKE